jgi:hypothetical protein
MSIGKSYTLRIAERSPNPFFSTFAKQKIDVNANLSTMDEAAQNRKTGGVTYAKNCFSFAVAGGG